MSQLYVHQPSMPPPPPPSPLGASPCTVIGNSQLLYLEYMSWDALFSSLGARGRPYSPNDADLMLNGTRDGDFLQTPCAV